jgi:hypothetical protein
MRTEFEGEMLLRLARRPGSLGWLCTLLARAAGRADWLPWSQSRLRPASPAYLASWIPLNRDEATALARRLGVDPAGLWGLVVTLSVQPLPPAAVAAWRENAVWWTRAYFLDRIGRPYPLVVTFAEASEVLARTEGVSSGVLLEALFGTADILDLLALLRCPVPAGGIGRLAGSFGVSEEGLQRLVLAARWAEQARQF